MAEDEDLLLAEGLANPLDQLLCIGLHSIDRERRSDGGRIVGDIGLARAALVPLDDGEVFVPALREVPARRHGHPAGAAMEHEQHGIARVSAADR